MHPSISQEYSPMLSIYTDSMPDFIYPFLESPTLKRLSGVWQHCGTEFTKLYKYGIKESRLDHSLWVACIVWNFTHDPAQTLSGLFHDVSHSVFSHVGDFLLWDAEKQESSEKHTTELLKADPVIMKELENLWIPLSAVEDYSIYPIADNPGPQLAADRLEYTLTTPISLWYATHEEIKEIYDDIKIVENEKWQMELGFKSVGLAEKFWLLSIRNDAGCFSSYESVVGMSFLSEILKVMLKKQMFRQMDLYTMKDEDIFTMIEVSNDRTLQEMLEYFRSISSYKIQRYEPKTKNYYVSTKCKRRCVDPLAETPNGTLRVSQFSETFREKRDYHIQRQEEWIVLDYIMR